MTGEPTAHAIPLHPPLVERAKVLSERDILTVASDHPEVGSGWYSFAVHFFERDWCERSLGQVPVAVLLGAP